MFTKDTSAELHEIRARVVAKVRELRRARGLTQADLGARLGLSQARLSEIERGDGSFTAEQLIALLGLFNVDIGQFLLPIDRDDELQNALIRHGATHLRQVHGIAPSGRYDLPADAILAVLLDPRAARLVTALGPVLLQNADTVSLPALRERLDATARMDRLGWLIENVRDALLLPPPGADPTWRRLANRAITVLSNELDRFSPYRPQPDAPTDLFDPSIRSPETLELVWEHQTSPISRRWGVATDLQPDDFRRAIWQAHELR